MKYLILALLLCSCATSKKVAESSYDAEMVCKFASLEYPNTPQASAPKRTPEEINSIKNAFVDKLSGFKACRNDEAKRSDDVGTISLCYVVGTDQNGKTIYSKFYSHDDKKFSKEFFECLDKNRPELSSFKSIKVTQPFTIRPD